MKPLMLILLLNFDQTTNIYEIVIYCYNVLQATSIPAPEAQEEKNWAKSDDRPAKVVWRKSGGVYRGDQPGHPHCYEKLYTSS